MGAVIHPMSYWVTAPPQLLARMVWTSKAEVADVEAIFSAIYISYPTHL